jgi:protein-L-isoaspartate O-methyltransferase
MGFYRSFVFPRLCDLALDQPYVAGQRKELLAGAAGRVLEIGFGSGLNLAYYPTSVRRITTVEPNPGMGPRARRRAEKAGIEVDQRQLGGESLPFARGSSTASSARSRFAACATRGGSWPRRAGC